MCKHKNLFVRLFFKLNWINLDSEDANSEGLFSVRLIRRSEPKAMNGKPAAGYNNEHGCKKHKCKL